VSALLEVDSLTVTIETPTGPVTPVAEVSFEVQAGKTVGLVGESGSGKSVTALSLMRLHDEALTTLSGAVRFKGREVLHLPEPEFRALRGSQLAMIFQDPQASLNPALRIGVQVGEALAIHQRMGRAERHRRAVELLGDVGIASPAETVHAYPHQLSGGMRQRVIIAAALACAPQLVIADEPTTALDVTIQAQIMELLVSLQKSRGMGMLLISHDLGLIAESCDEVVVMYAGRTVERGPTRAVFDSPAHPYTAGLIASTPLLGREETRLREIPGVVPELRALPSGCRFRDRCPKAEANCAAEEPKWVVREDGRWHRCHFPAEAR